MSILKDIEENYNRILYEINDTASKYGTKPPEVIAVTKTVPPEAVNMAIECGIRLIGENRVQEYLSKREFYSHSQDVSVHFIGRLQSNKVRQIVPYAQVIQSVDSLSLAAEIDRQALKYGKIQDVLIEINTGSEDSKGGVPPSELDTLITAVLPLENINIRGLMAIPPPDRTQEGFALMHDLFAKVSEVYGMDMLSMGMSSDYKLAVKYAATVTRIGTALFGKRN
ncbi:MAG: YggS family pyridoxal phosphate-dependent enzyme [Oscillospiraceae bacterium]|jgi:pyridoxal phosphate enzyme (YggS family)|nr:YggS family pyridoxal phosphate-dependent enzyme [Oscillospiraceae bacterium]